MKFTVDSDLIKAQHGRRLRVSIGATVFLAYMKSKVGSDLEDPLRPDSMMDYPEFVNLSSNQVKKDLGWDRIRQAKYLNELSRAGVIEVRKAGFPGPRRYVNPNLAPPPKPKKPLVKR